MWGSHVVCVGSVVGAQEVPAEQFVLWLAETKQTKHDRDSSLCEFQMDPVNHCW